MALENRLDVGLHQQQTLRMTPQLQQAIKLLQYNKQQLAEHIEQELVENPTLERLDVEEGPSGEDRGTAEGDEARAEQEPAPDALERLEWWTREREGRTAPSIREVRDDLPPIETNLTYVRSLADHLLEQLQLTQVPEDVGRAAVSIIGNLDERGYLQASIEEIARQEGLDEDVVRRAQELVQSFDPVGCGATDLAQCLVVQARLRYPEDELFETILTRHLENLQRKNYQAIARDLDIEVEDVIEYHKMIRELEPRPGRAFSSGETRYVEPEVFVVKRGGKWVVEIDEGNMPGIRISPYYREVARSANPEDRKYIQRKLQNAEFLIKSIDRRRRTIRRVVEKIVELQSDFFERGPEGLKPMILQDVADALNADAAAQGEDESRSNIHMSTISRVTSNKYVHTPWGVFELKYFFTSGVRQNTGVQMSNEVIKSRIKALIASEDPKRPLSDQALADALAKDGIKVARRTVAKYRESLGILSSSKRKNLF